jgi:hypothetical protein
MEEYDGYENGEPRPAYEQLFDMFDMLADAGYSPSHILVGCGMINLRKWIPKLSRKSTTIFGVPLVFSGYQMEEDVLVVCGAKIPDAATAADIGYAIKVTLP